MVDLETVEALYENVSVTTAHYKNNTAQFASAMCDFEPIDGYFMVDPSASAARGTGENQETLRDIRRRGS